MLSSFSCPDLTFLLLWRLQRSFCLSVSRLAVTEKVTTPLEPPAGSASGLLLTSWWGWWGPQERDPWQRETVCRSRRVRRIILVTTFPWWADWEGSEGRTADIWHSGPLLSLYKAGPVITITQRRVCPGHLHNTMTSSQSGWAWQREDHLKNSHLLQGSVFIV